VTSALALARSLALAGAAVVAFASCSAPPKPLLGPDAPSPSPSRALPAGAVWVTSGPLAHGDEGTPVLVGALGASPGFGRHATPEEIAALDIDVAPDGAGLPLGSGTASEGAPIYAARCAHCHGAAGEGGPADRLVGGVGTLTSAQPLLTTGSFWPYATTLFDYLRRAMPYDSPGSLSANEVYALTAFLLEGSGVIAAEARLDAASLPALRMPNRDGFESAWPPGKP